MSPEDKATKECFSHFKHSYYGWLKCQLKDNHTDENHYNYACDVDWPVKTNPEEQTLAELKEAIREARECLKDFNEMRKEYNKIAKNWRDKVDHQIALEVRAGLDHYEETLSKAMKEASSRIFAKFDRLAAMIMGEDKKHLESIPELLRRKQQGSR